MDAVKFFNKYMHSIASLLISCYGNNSKQNLLESLSDTILHFNCYWCTTSVLLYGTSVWRPQGRIADLDTSRGDDCPSGWTKITMYHFVWACISGKSLVPMLQLLHVLQINHHILPFQYADVQVTLYQVSFLQYSYMNISSLHN